MTADLPDRAADRERQIFGVMSDRPDDAHPGVQEPDQDVPPALAARPALDDGEARCDPRTCSGHPVGDGVTSGGVVRHMSDPYRTAPSSPGSGDALHGRLAEAARAEMACGTAWYIPTGQSIATALLPVVREAIADELDAAAAEFRENRDDASGGIDPGDPWTYNEAALICQQRADALRDGTRA